ncbi:ATPase 4, plasma membrane-type [Camellia lanceoleosa]|uniref:ATPase 4, plasma membrane-type n=1 Tax=Camellia lanceoleosa TaxID=1840588 RepID=A0ACC0IN84_9ERIC|nr:ATPase 4, plasma membrane-type [Camellia lanceoleosa]
MENNAHNVAAALMGCLAPKAKVFPRGVDGEAVVLMAVRASRVENQDAINAAIVGTLADLKEVLNLAHNKSEIERRVHAVIDKFAEQGLRSRAVAYQCAMRFAGSATILCLDLYSIHRLLRIAGLGVGVFLFLALRISVPKVDSWDVVLVVVL